MPRLDSDSVRGDCGKGLVSWKEMPGRCVRDVPLGLMGIGGGRAGEKYVKRPQRDRARLLSIHPVFIHLRFYEWLLCISHTGHSSELDRHGPCLDGTFHKKYI